MITVIIGDNCPNCHKLTKHLEKKGVKFERLHRKQNKARQIIYNRGIKGIPATIFKKGAVDLTKIGYSIEIVNEISRMYRNSN